MGQRAIPSRISRHSYHPGEQTVKSKKLDYRVTGERSKATQGTDFVFFAHQVEDLREEWRHFRLAAEDIVLLNPESGTCPIFRSQRDAELAKSIYSQDGTKTLEQSAWGGFYIRLIDFSDHGEMILAEEQLKEGSCDEFYVYHSSQDAYVRLYEAKLFHQFDHRYATFAEVSQASSYNGNAREVSVEERCNPIFVVKPRYWIHIGLFRQIIERYDNQNIMYPENWTGD